MPLKIVATPIGNLKDITLRAIEALQECDGVICEDSRRTGILLNNFKINKEMIALNDFNESRVFPQIIQRLILGQNLCLVSDAGTPLISDPGYKLVRECIKSNIPIDSLPGPTAAITALTLSGMPPDKFIYLGYLPEKQGARIKMIQNIEKINNLIKSTFIVYVAPHKLERTLGDIKDTLGDIEITLAKELTKINQNVATKKITSFLKEFKDKKPRGEWVLLITLPS